MQMKQLMPLQGNICCMNIGTIKLPYMSVNTTVNVTYKTLCMWIYYTDQQILDD
jgi:hypothetical protein